MLALLPSGACRTGVVEPKDTGFIYTWEMDPDQGPIPFGLWGLNGFHDADGLVRVRDRFGLSLFHTSTHAPNFAVTTLLPMVREAGLHVNLRMAGDHTFYTDANGDFDIEAWKDMLRPWSGSGVQEYIDDGTIAYHMLLDDIANFSGRPPDGDDLDELARTSKEILPGLKVAVREESSKIPVPSAGRFEYVDASINQYMSIYGDVEAYAIENQGASNALGLEIVNGLNIADGGDGSSRQPGWSEGRWAMSANEIITYGHVLSAVPGCVLFMAWEYDGEELWSDGSVGSDYFDRPENTAALRWLSDRLAGEDVERP